ncbi:hypothetical protein [Sporosarcina sp. SAFN-010]|uniref:hypothetical protein n=1 Tax=Sporosarcina sp. SAFN-010 TaxID=3387273 RepID=UPI003F7F7C15
MPHKTTAALPINPLFMLNCVSFPINSLIVLFLGVNLPISPIIVPIHSLELPIAAVILPIPPWTCCSP